MRVGIFCIMCHLSLGREKKALLSVQYLKEEEDANDWRVVMRKMKRYCIGGVT